MSVFLSTSAACLSARALRSSASFCLFASISARRRSDMACWSWLEETRRVYASDRRLATARISFRALSPVSSCLDDEQQKRKGKRWGEQRKRRQQQGLCTPSAAHHRAVHNRQLREEMVYKLPRDIWVLSSAYIQAQSGGRVRRSISLGVAARIGGDDDTLETRLLREGQPIPQRA